MVKITHHICLIFNYKFHSRFAYERWCSWLTIIFRNPCSWGNICGAVETRKLQRTSGSPLICGDTVVIVGSQSQYDTYNRYIKFIITEILNFPYNLINQEA